MMFVREFLIAKCSTLRISFGWSQSFITMYFKVTKNNNISSTQPRNILIVQKQVQYVGGTKVVAFLQAIFVYLLILKQKLRSQLSASYIFFRILWPSLSKVSLFYQTFIVYIFITLRVLFKFWKFFDGYRQPLLLQVLDLR